MQTTSTINNPILQVGSQSNLVKELQQLLNLFNYKLTVDGVFGVNTKKAVQAFQASHSHEYLVADGIVGHETWEVLYVNVFRAAPNAMPILQLGSKGEAVQLLQCSLNQFRNIVAVDGNFGPNTDAAVRAVQKNNRLRIDGIVGSKTWIAISLMENE